MSTFELASLVSHNPDFCSSEQEEDRLQESADYQLLRMLEDLEDSAFDQVTEIASIICEVPIALVSLVGRERQSIKSKKGLDGHGHSQNLSICKDAFLQPGLFIVPDTAQDSRFANTPLVACAPHLRFYAGVQLKNKQGQQLGTLCILGSVPINIFTFSTACDSLSACKQHGAEKCPDRI